MLYNTSLGMFPSFLKEGPGKDPKDFRKGPAHSAT